MRNLSCAVNVRRRGRSKSSGDAAAGADKEDGWRPTIVSPPAAARVLLSLIWGITTGCLSYAPKGKLPAGVCLIIIDGVDGPTSTASKCQGVGAGGATMKETVHERVYQNRRRSGQAVYSDSCAGEQGRARGEAQVAALEISRIFRRCRALPHRHGGLRLGALLGAPASRDGSRRAADATDRHGGERRGAS